MPPYRTEDEKEDSSSEEEDNDVKRIGDELLGKVVNVNCSLSNECYPAVVSNNIHLCSSLGNSALHHMYYAGLLIGR